MKKILIILGLFLTIIVNGQISTGIVANQHRTVAGGGATYDPPTPDGTIWAWWVGSYDASFTESGGVEVWADSLGSGHDLEYYTSETTSKPARSAGVVTFDGVNDELRTNNGMSFTLADPCTYIMVMKQITWTDVDRMIAGRVNSSTRLYQYDETNEIDLMGGSAPGDIGCTDLALDTWEVVIAVFNGANSFIQVDGGTNRTVTGDIGGTNPDGISLGCDPGHSNFGNAAFREVIIVEGIEDATNLTAWTNYLKARYGL